jgi:hypothetical protein
MSAFSPNFFRPETSSLGNESGVISVAALGNTIHLLAFARSGNNDLAVRVGPQLAFDLRYRATQISTISIEVDMVKS